MGDVRGCRVAGVCGRVRGAGKKRKVSMLKLQIGITPSGEYREVCSPPARDVATRLFSFALMCFIFLSALVFFPFLLSLFLSLFPFFSFPYFCLFIGSFPRVSDASCSW